MKKIIYVTSNKIKVDYLKSVLNSDEFEIEQKKIDCPEIQSDFVEEVAKYSAKWASERLNCDVLKNDSGLVIPALNGFPNAYSKYVEEVLGPDGILKLMKGITDRTAYYIDAFAYCEKNKEPIVFVSKSYGTISKRKSGKYGNGYDKIFVPKNKSVTMAHMSYKEFLTCFDNTAVYELSSYLQKR